MIGVLSSTARRAANAAARAKEETHPDVTETPAGAPAAKENPTARRRRATVERLGRGHEYMDLEPTVTPSTEGAGPLGFSGTAAKVSAGAATGLATLADDDFGGSARMPMMPSTWGGDSPDEAQD
jgi:PPE-repeat protein